MSGKDEKGRDGVTIVGGRPMHRAVSVSELPVGIEQALTLAALDYRFRDDLLSDPVRAAAGKGIELDEVEAALLRNTDPKKLMQMAKRTVRPAGSRAKEGRRVSRRSFMKNVAASVAVLVGGKAFLLCSGCTGADSWEPTPDAGQKEPIQRWAELAGYTCYVYIPVDVQTPTLHAAPLLVALSDEGETCLSTVQRWSPVADANGFSILAVNWTESQMSQAERDQLADDLSEVVVAYGAEYPVDWSRCHLASRGESSPIVFRAAMEQDPGTWASVAFLGGMIDVQCSDYGQGQPPPFDLVEPHPAVYYVVGKEDTEYAEVTTCCDMLDFYGVTVQLEEVEGTTDLAVLQFSSIWEWMSTHTSGV